MKKYWILALLLVPCLLGAQAVDNAAAQADPAERNKMLYSLGFLLGGQPEKTINFG